MKLFYGLIRHSMRGTETFIACRFSIVLVLMLLHSCDRPPCQNENDVFRSFSVYSNEYKTELASRMNQIKGDRIRYWFEEYIEKDGDAYMVVNIQGPELCAQGEILVNDWTNLGKIKKNRGKGYRGAELKGLKINIQKDSVSTNFVFQGLDRIID